MKKLMLVLAAFAMLCGTAVSAQEVNEISKKDMKTIEKTAKSLAKKNIKEGWELVESTTMEEAVKEVLIAKKKGCQEIVGTAYGKKDMVVAKTGARNAAINEYVEYSKSMVTARINTDLQDISGQEVSNLIAGYERMVVKEINGELRPAYTIYKRNRDKVDVKSYFIVDVDAAAAARERALKQAAEEAELAHKYGEDISKFVRDGFDTLKTIGE